MSSRRRERGAAMAELAVLLPILLTTLMAVIDFGRLVYCYQVTTDLTREAANLVSRGSDVEDVWAAAATADGPIQLDESGEMIVSVVRRRSSTDGTPWIFEQTSNGPLTNVTSKVGSLNQKAKIPHVTSLATGVTITTVEVYHNFEPIFVGGDTTLDVYPSVIYGAAFF
jgi:Flp pilus assembly protein TadG